MRLTIAQRGAARRRCPRRVFRLPLVVGLLLIMALPASVSAASPPNAPEKLAFMGGDYYDVMTATEDGSHVRRATNCEAVEDDCDHNGPKVSPDGGQMVVEWGWSTLELMRPDGSYRRILVDDPEHYAYAPTWSPDGSTIFYNRGYDGTEYNEDIYGISATAEDSSGFEAFPIITGPGDQGYADFSPDGSKIVYEQCSGVSACEWSLWTADSDGKNRKEIPIDLTGFGSGYGPWEPQWSPDGTRIAFYAAPDEEFDHLEIYVMDVDGSNVEQLTDNLTDDAAPRWSPDGTEIVFQRGCNDPECRVFRVQLDQPSKPIDELVTSRSLPDYSGEELPSFRKGGAFFDSDDVLAARFAPFLKFDTTERWRPLNVDHFMREADPETPEDSYNQICADEVGCQDIDTDWVSQMRTFGELTDPHLQMGIKDGADPITQYDYVSPYAGCVKDFLQDCNDANSSIYFHVSPSAMVGTTPPLSGGLGGYNYIDYWVFYRFNGQSGNHHEGDWEGLTVGPSPGNPETFDFVSFAQHNDLSTHAADWPSSHYARDLLSCDGGGTDSCGTDEDPEGTHVWGFVANDSHATYPHEAEGCIPWCHQDRQPLLPEGEHDGDADWAGNNGDFGELLRFPAALGWQNPLVGNWVDWPGKWGGRGSGVDSPGAQPRFKCPGADNPADVVVCPSKRQAQVAGIAKRNADLKRCRGWFGAGLVATACSPSQLSRAVRSQRLGRNGTFRLGLHRQAKRMASIPGVAQALAAPLRPGARLRLRGRLPRDTKLLVRVQRGNRVHALTFEDLASSGRGAAVLRVAKQPRRSALTLANGRRIYPSAVHITRQRPVAIDLSPEPSSQATAVPRRRPTKCWGQAPEWAVKRQLRRRPSPSTPHAQRHRQKVARCF